MAESRCAGGRESCSIGYGRSSSRILGRACHEYASWILLDVERPWSSHSSTPMLCVPSRLPNLYVVRGR